jgi:hypothetical protein
VSGPPARWQPAFDTQLPAGQTSRRQFWFAEALPAGASNVHYAYAPVEKLGVVLTGDDAGGPASASTFCSSLVRLDDGRYRLY